MPGVTTRKTPGVYITELPAFPPSIPGVDTAVPAFIGYTEKAVVRGQPYFNVALEIGSMADFEQYFGGPYRPLYDIIEALDSPLTSDDYDFTVLDPTTSPAMPRFFKLTQSPKLPDPVVEYDDLDDEIDPIKIPKLAQFNLYNSMQLYYANGGGKCWVVSVGDYASTVSSADLLTGLTAIEAQTGPTMLVIPDAILLPPSPKGPVYISADFNTVVTAMLAQCAKKQDRVAVLDVYGSTAVPSAASMTDVIDAFKAGVGDKYLDYGMAYFPMLYTTVASGEINYQNINGGRSFDLLVKILTWEAMNLYPTTYEKVVKSLIDPMEPLPPAADRTEDEMAFVVKNNNNLKAALPLLGDIEADIAELNSVLPPSGAIAGVYKYNDTSRGVWNAPANIALAGVSEPTYIMSGDEQGEMNVPLDGKSVCAIRLFTGQGTLVWGARTLDGNSNDFRYIQVRRTLIYLEQSIKVALTQFVFAPNDGNTWSTVTAMVSSFLQGFWSSGGLMGATPAEAFSVTCGLGSTMTAQDILEGYMRVQVVLQMIRPAEFIELTFTQKMEGAG